MRLASWVVGAVMLCAAGARAEENATSAQVTLHEVEVSIRASSVLKDAKDPERYSPAHLLDDNPATVWSEGSAGEGVGEWVELSFPPGTQVDSFLVTPGNTKSAALYRANARPRQMRLELKFVDHQDYGYTLDFPRNAPLGSSLYVMHRTPWTLKSVRLAVLSVWPGSRYRDLCLGTFVPVFKGADKNFRGQGQELAPTLSLFLHQDLFVTNFLPAEPIDEPVWLRLYDEVPRDGPLPTPFEEYDLHKTPRSSWSENARSLANDQIAAEVASRLFRVTPVAHGKGYVLDPSTPPKSESSGNFRLRWRFVEGQWRLVEIDMKYREEEP